MRGAPETCPILVLIGRISHAPEFAPRLGRGRCDTVVRLSAHECTTVPKRHAVEALKAALRLAPLLALCVAFKYI